MKIFNKSISLSIIIAIIFLILPKNSINATTPSLDFFREKPVKMAIVMYNVFEPYPSQIVQNLKIIGEENKDKIELTFFNCNNDETLENKYLNEIISSKQFDVILVDLLNINNVSNVVNKVKASNIPLIIFHNEPYSMDSIKSYNKAMFIGSPPEEGGVLQGEILINEWNKHKNTIDYNRDNVMQYILLRGNVKSLDTIGRSKASVSTIRSAGIQTTELASAICNWEKEEARKATESLLLQFGDKIEVINSNNDYMAIGAIEALQAYGYNKGGNSRTIPVIGVDGLPEAIELINKSFMTNTVIQDAKGTADALYICGMNLAQGKKPIDGTNYKFDESGVAIRIPYMIYKPLN